MKKALIIRYAAYGDIIHMSWIPRALKEVYGYDIVDVETNPKGYNLLAHNPFIDNLTCFDPNLYPDMQLVSLTNRWDIMSLGYDKTINLFRSLEYGCIAMEDMTLYYMDDESRRKFGAGNYYDITAKVAGLHEMVGKARGEVFFSDKENEMSRSYFDSYKDKFKVVLNVNGTGHHKRIKRVQELADAILCEIPDAFIFTTGDGTIGDIKHTEGRTYSWCGVAPFREILARIRYVDLIIGHESGMMCGASMWGTPAIQIMTAASLENHVKYADNDYSIQSPAKCSPCHKGPYKYRGCPKRDGLPVCVDIDVETIMKQVRRAYERAKVPAV